MNGARRPSGLVALLLAVAGCGGGEGRSDDPADAYRRDERVARLLECRGTGPYDRDTSWAVPILIEKLRTGESAVLKRAKEELGDLGEEALPELRRFVDRHYADAFDAPLLESAMAAVAHSDAPGAREILLLGAQHPQESVRSQALVGLLGGHATREDFDDLAVRLDGPEGATVKGTIARALFTADRPRAELRWLEWMRAGEHRGLWEDVAPELVGTDSAEAARRASGVFASMPARIAPWLAAPAARFGDPSALAFLREELASPEPSRRLLAVTALGRARMPDELGEAATDDPALEVRVKAVEGIAEAPELLPRHRDWLAAALDDAAPEVRSPALERLVEAGDDAAIDRALAELGAPPERMLVALRVLTGPMRADPALAERAWGALERRDELERHRPLRDRLPTLKGMGLVPLAVAAERLREIGLEHAGETIEGLRAHRWAMIQAGNTGDAGRRWLRAALDGEADPARRLDLIGAIGADSGELARRLLLELAEDDGLDAYERLFAAEGLTRLGPTKTLAPRLKRVAYAIETPDARQALHCLLWRWY